MADSNYYKSQYQNYKDQANKYIKNINELTKIKNSLTADFSDEQSNVNQKLSDLQDDLKESVRYDSGFTVAEEQCETYIEKSTSADSTLQSVIIYLENEISSLNQKKNAAENNMNTSLNNYNAKKEEEQQALLDSNKLI